MQKHEENPSVQYDSSKSGARSANPKRSKRTKWNRVLRRMRKPKFLLALLTGVAIPVLVAAGTLYAAASQFRVANDRSDQMRFVDGAQATAQETVLLLDEGYNDLETLFNSTGSEGWKTFSKGAFHTYMESHRRWRQHLVSHHFKLARYFGKDFADQLIHIDEIDRRPVDNLSSPNPCAPPGTADDFDFQKMSFQTWCTITRIPLMQDVIDDKKRSQPIGEFLDAIEARRTKEEFAQELLKNYDKQMVIYLRQLNDRLTRLGQPQLTMFSHTKSK